MADIIQFNEAEQVPDTDWHTHWRNVAASLSRNLDPDAMQHHHEQGVAKYGARVPAPMETLPLHRLLCRTWVETVDAAKANGRLDLAERANELQREFLRIVCELGDTIKERA
jgi:hypothetical protein